MKLSKKSSKSIVKKVSNTHTKNRKIPKHYLPKGLSKKDKQKQLNSITKGYNRPHLSSAPKMKKSRFVVMFEKKYDTKITDDAFISKHIITKKGIHAILHKGRGAYYSSGSRPNVTAEQWARARLASVIVAPKGGARRVDKAIWDKYKV